MIGFYGSSVKKQTSDEEITEARNALKLLKQKRLDNESIPFRKQYSAYEYDSPATSASSASNYYESKEKGAKRNTGYGSKFPQERDMNPQRQSVSNVNGNNKYRMCFNPAERGKQEYSNPQQRIQQINSMNKKKGNVGLDRLNRKLMDEEERENPPHRDYKSNLANIAMNDMRVKQQYSDYKKEKPIGQYGRIESKRKEDSDAKGKQKYIPPYERKAKPLKGSKEREPWNNDFASTDDILDSTPPPSKKESEKERKPAQKRQKYIAPYQRKPVKATAEREPWNDDFGDTEEQTEATPPPYSKPPRQKPKPPTHQKAPLFDNDFGAHDSTPSYLSSASASTSAQKKISKPQSHYKINSASPANNPPPRNPRIKKQPQYSDNKYKSASSASQPASYSAAPVSDPIEDRPIGGSNLDVAEYAQDTATAACPHCARTFNPTALSKHVKACKGIFMQKVKPKDLAQNRVGHLEDEKKSYSSKPARFGKKQPERKVGASAAAGRGAPGRMNKAKESEPLPGSKIPKWKLQSMQFRNAMKSTKGDGDGGAGSGGGGYNEASLFTPCPHCGRTFNDQAAERHIPICGQKARMNKFKNPPNKKMKR